MKGDLGGGIHLQAGRTDLRPAMLVPGGDAVSRGARTVGRFPAAAHCCNAAFKNGAMRLTLCRDTSSGVPLATSLPPSSPASGPMSTT